MLSECSYSLCWDNVQKLAVRRHQGSSTGNKFHLWAMAFGSLNRIPSLHLNDDFAACTPALEIPMTAFLPDKSDWDALRNRMNILVQRIMIKQSVTLKSKFEKYVVMHIPHRYSEECKEKSKIVSKTMKYLLLTIMIC